jgi:hypothetical protein
VKWEVGFHKDFDPEFDVLPDDVQSELLAHARLLEQFGPQLGRPRVDTLKGSRHANMKELRFDAADSVWRVAGDKSGGCEHLSRTQTGKRGDSHVNRAEGQNAGTAPRPTQEGRDPCR